MCKMQLWRVVVVVVPGTQPFIQISCHSFWNYISWNFKMQEWPEIATNSCKVHVICSLYIYIMNYHDSLRFKNDLKCNQFMQISCQLFWNYIYICIYLSHGILDAKIILKMQPIHANFMSFVLGLYMYHVFLDTRIIWKCNQFMQISSHLFWKFKIQKLSALQPVHTIFMFYDVLWCLRHKFIKKSRDIFIFFHVFGDRKFAQFRLHICTQNESCEKPIGSLRFFFEYFISIIKINKTQKTKIYFNFTRRKK
jgi:hypothetical protein